MEETLRDLIVQMRSALIQRDDGPVVGDIPEGNPSAQFEVDSWREVLVECDGGRFGAIDLWSTDELPANSGIHLDVSNPENFVPVGQILYEPIAAQRSTGDLYWLPHGDENVELGSASHFLSYFVFGAGYAELIPNVEDEPWWNFTASHRER